MRAAQAFWCNFWCKFSCKKSNHLWAHGNAVRGVVCFLMGIVSKFRAGSIWGRNQRPRRLEVQCPQLVGQCIKPGFADKQKLHPSTAHLQGT